MDNHQYGERHYDENLMKYVGYIPYPTENGDVSNFFTQRHVDYVSKAVTDILFEKFNQVIVVPNDTISGVMNSIFYNTNPKIASIYSVLQQPAEDMDWFTESINRAIRLISHQIITETLTENHNKSLNVWHANFLTTPSGIECPFDMTRHGHIKLKNTHPTRMQFHMRY